MVAFFYLLGVIVSFIVLAYLDVKGSTFFDMRPRAEVSDTDARLMFGGLGCLVWPMSVALFAVALFYRGLIMFFSRKPKELRLWSCPTIKSAVGYRDPIERCAVMAKSVKRPKCGKHHCDMVEHEE